MFPLHDAIHARVAGGRITQAYRAGRISAKEHRWALEALAKAHARFGIGGVKSNVVHLPKVTRGAHTCHACKTRIAGHPVSFHEHGTPARHYHAHHAHHQRKAA